MSQFGFAHATHTNALASKLRATREPRKPSAREAKKKEKTEEKNLKYHVNTAPESLPTPRLF